MKLTKVQCWVITHGLPLRGNVVVPNNDSNQEDSLEGMQSLVDDS